MLASVVVVVRLTDPTELDRPTAERLFLGRAAQALFLERVAARDRALAASLHDSAGPKPYTCGASLVPPPVGGEGWHVRLHYTALETTLARGLADLLGALSEPLRLDTLAGTVEVLATDEAADRDAGQTSYEEILNRRLLAAAEPESRFVLRFLTPTTFHTGGTNQPLPLPGLVFGSLVDRWNAFSRLTLSPEARRYAEECLVVSHFRLVSQMVEVAGGKQVGAVGTVTYRSVRPDPYWLRVIGALADFACYGGVGAKTTMGLGQTRRVLGDGRSLRGRAGSDAA